MANTTQNRDSLVSDGIVYSYGVASGVELFAGTLGMVLGASSLLTKAAAGTTQFVGVIEDYANNTASNVQGVSPIANGAVKARVFRRGIFRFQANAAPTASDINKFAVVVDDQTVGVTSTPGLSLAAGYVTTAVGRIVGAGTTPYNFFDVDINPQANTVTI